MAENQGNNHGVFVGSITAEVRAISERVREHAAALAKVREDVIVLKVESRLQARMGGFISGGVSAAGVIVLKWILDTVC